MKKYNFVTNRESMISRLPSLFPYLEWDENGICKLHPSTDSINGSYGKIVPNMNVPVKRPFQSTPGNDEPQLSANIGVLPDKPIQVTKNYSYNDLMELYYKGTDDTIVSFVETAIGKITIDKTEFDDNCDLVPDFVYLATVKELYFIYLRMQKRCLYYDTIGKSDSNMCCYCERYKRMGGDKMLEKLGELTKKAQSIAEEYLGYTNERLTIKYNIPLSQSIDDLGILSTRIEKWVPGKEYYKGDVVLYNDDIYECNFSSVVKGHYNEDTEKIEFEPLKWKKNKFICNSSQSEYDCNKIDDSRKIQGFTDSKLTSLRRYVEYMNAFDETESPSYGEDWLFYYRKGYVANYRTVNDLYGNIGRFNNPNYDDVKGEEPKTHIGDFVTDLKAYGDVMDDIFYDTEKHTISFVYYIDCHLKAKFQKTIVDDDGNNKYLFSDFKRDENDTHGVKYIDEYYYQDGSDIDTLIKKGEFNDYVTGFKQDGTPYVLSGQFNLFTKFEFSTLSSMFDYKININNEDGNIQSVLSKFEASTAFNKNDEDVIDVPIVRYDYLNGITYAPTEDIDVYINRGNTAAFEKHLNFAGIKDLEDMENFKNGGFFEMHQDS